MDSLPLPQAETLPHTFAAPQHKPRPLPLFLELLRSETAASTERRVAALAGLRRYQEAGRAPRTAYGKLFARAGRASLIDYGGTGPAIVFVPSLINPPHVLDLAPDSSLLRWLAGQGFRPLLVDWGAPSAEERTLTVGGHVETMLLPLLRALGEPVTLVGYCLGGTMALAAAANLPLRGLVMIAAPWDFAGFPDAARSDLKALWDQAEPTAARLGLLPMEVLQTSFWRLSPERTIGKFVDFGRRAADDPAVAGFVALEDWANDGPPLTYAAGRELLIEMFEGNVTGEGRWIVGGRRILPESIACPVLNIVSTTDRIVPHASAARLGERRDLALGHVGMIVGGRARRSLWEPLAAWLSHPHAT